MSTKTPLVHRSGAALHRERQRDVESGWRVGVGPAGAVESGRASTSGPKESEEKAGSHPEVASPR